MNLNLSLEGMLACFDHYFLYEMVDGVRFEVIKVAEEEIDAIVATIDMNDSNNPEQVAKREKHGKMVKQMLILRAVDMLVIDWGYEFVNLFDFIYAHHGAIEFKVGSILNEATWD